MRNGKGACRQTPFPFCRCGSNDYLPELPAPPPRLEPESAPRPAEPLAGAEAAGALPELPEEEDIETGPAERDEVL